LKEVVYRYYSDGNIRSISTKLASGDYVEHLVYEILKREIVLGKPEMHPIPEDD
jgi:hypothetical protein